MTLADAGPLAALVDRRDQHHADAVEAADALVGPMVTTWPCLTEAMYLVGRASGFAGQDRLWDMVDRGTLVVRHSLPAELARMADLMRSYRDLPMDLADASIVTAAEVTQLRRVFTFDAHFRVYVLADGSVLDVVP